MGNGVWENQAHDGADWVVTAVVALAGPGESRWAFALAWLAQPVAEAVMADVTGKRAENDQLYTIQFSQRRQAVLEGWWSPEHTGEV